MRRAARMPSWCEHLFRILETFKIYWLIYLSLGFYQIFLHIILSKTYPNCSSFCVTSRWTIPLNVFLFPVTSETKHIKHSRLHSNQTVTCRRAAVREKQAAEQVVTGSPPLSTQQQWTSLCPDTFNVLLCQQVVTKILMFYIPVTKVLVGFWNNRLLEKHKQESSESSFVSDGKWAWTQTAAVMRMWACHPWTSCWTTNWREAGPACSMCSLFPCCFSQKKAFVSSSDLTKSHVLPLSQNDKYSMMTCRCVTGSYENFDDATVKWMWWKVTADEGQHSVILYYYTNRVLINTILTKYFTILSYTLLYFAMLCYTFYTLVYYTKTNTI